MTERPCVPKGVMTARPCVPKGVMTERLSFARWKLSARRLTPAERLSCARWRRSARRLTPTERPSFRQMEAQRAEAHADREALRAEAREDRLTFARQIAIITREQAHLNGLVEGMRDEDDHPGSATDSPRDG